MKKYIIVLSLLLTSMGFYAQSYDGKGDTKLNIGYDVYGFGRGVSASFDYGLSELFSVGFGGRYYTENMGDIVSSYYIFARAAIHLGAVLDFDRKFDMYPGADLGYLDNYVGFNPYLGLRYFFSDKIGLGAEIGRSGNISISYNF